MTEDFTYYGPALTGRHPHIGPMPADATVLQPAEMADLRARLAALDAAVEAALVEAEAERVRLVAQAALWKRAAKRWRGRARREKARREYDSVDAYNARISEALRGMEVQP